MRVRRGCIECCHPRRRHAPHVQPCLTSGPAIARKWETTLLTQPSSAEYSTTVQVTRATCQSRRNAHAKPEHPKGACCILHGDNETKRERMTKTKRTACWPTWWRLSTPSQPNPLIPALIPAPAQRVVVQYRHRPGTYRQHPPHKSYHNAGV